MRKAIFPFICLALLAGCAALNPQRANSCNMMASELSWGESWTNECMMNDSAFTSGYRQVAQKSKPEELCASMLEPGVSTDLQAILSDVAGNRKINCQTYFLKTLRTQVKTMSMPQLCTAWSTGTGNQEAAKIIRQEVAERKVDCPGVLAAQAQAAQAIFSYQQMQNQNAIQQQLLNPPRQQYPLVKPRITTTCRETIGIGNPVECVSR